MTKTAPVMQHRHKLSAIAGAVTILHEAVGTDADPRLDPAGFFGRFEP
jgi:hypothetical protein